MQLSSKSFCSFLAFGFLGRLVPGPVSVPVYSVLSEGLLGLGVRSLDGHDPSYSSSLSGPSVVVVGTLFSVGSFPGCRVFRSGGSTPSFFLAE